MSDVSTHGYNETFTEFEFVLAVKILFGTSVLGQFDS